MRNYSQILNLAVLLASSAIGNSMIAEQPQGHALCSKYDNKGVPKTLQGQVLLLFEVVVPWMRSRYDLRSGRAAADWYNIFLHIAPVNSSTKLTADWY